MFKPSKNLFQIDKWNIPKDSKIISYIGRLDKEKGLETLIKAFGILLKIILALGYWLLENQYCKGEYQNSLEQLSRIWVYKNAWNSSVTWPILPPFTKSVRYLFCPVCGRNHLEEQLLNQCGTPVVASKTGGIPEILTGEFQNGLLSLEMNEI